MAGIEWLDADGPALAGTLSRDTLEVPGEVGEKVLEDLIELQDEATAGELASAQEMLHELATWKLDLNRADEEALQSLPGVTPTDAARMVAYRESHGRFRTLDELRRAGLAQATIEDILPFLSINERLSVKAELVQRWSRRITRIRGHDADTSGSRYLGSPDALLTRFRMSIGRRFTVGGTLEKDPGEPLRSAVGHDFSAGYGVVSDLGPIDRIILGDYAADVAEGLALGQSSSMGTGPRSWRTRHVLRPHSSSREYGYFRGAAVRTRPLFGIQAAVMVSRKRIDARFDSTDGEWSFSSNGLHRTKSERSRYKDALESMVGWILSYAGSRLRLGLVGSTTQRDVRQETAATSRGLSGYLAWFSSHVALSTEFARRDSGHAISGALTVEPARSTQLWIQWVYATPGGSAPHSTIGVSSRGTARRERSWQTGLLLRPSDKWSWSFSSRRTLKPAHPVEGASIYLASTLEARLRRWITLRLRLTDHRSETLDACAADRRTFRCASIEGRKTLRFQIDYEHSRALRHRFQVEVSRGLTLADPSDAFAAKEHQATRRVNRHGILLYKDIRWQPSRIFHIDARIVFFEVSDYAARIYAFENDLLYSFSAPVFSGRGRRSYVILRLAPHRTWTLQIKYSVSSYEDVRTLGSGLDETVEPSRRDIRIQLRWKIG